MYKALSSNTLRRTVSGIIALLMCLTALVGCVNNTPDSSDTTPSDATTTPTPDTTPTTPDESSTVEDTTPADTTPDTPAETTYGADSTVAVPKENSTLRVLFIGNSLTFYNDMPAILMALGKAAGKDIYTLRATVGSSTMCQQISTTTEVGQKVDVALKQKWDYVVIQPSRRNTDQEDTVHQAELKAGKKLDRMIKDNGARTVIYGTWGNNSGSHQIFKMAADGINTTKVANYSISRKEHNEYMMGINEEFSRLLNAPIVNAAQMFEYMVNEHPQINMYYTDERHPSLPGSYAIACAFYSFFFNESAEAAAAKYHDGLDETTAKFLAQVADHIVRDSAEPTIKVSALPEGTVSTISIAPVEWKGSGTQSDPYIIENAGNFMYMANLSYEGEAFTGKYIKQTVDVDLKGGEFIPIGIVTPFRGNYDGGGHQIATASVTSEKSGIFAQTSGANISGIKVVSITFKGTFVGGVVGEAKDNTVISDCVVYQSSSMEGSSRIGGIVGNLLNSTVRTCVNYAMSYGKATDNCYTGGIVGVAADESIVELCYNEGDVSVNLSTNNKNACAGGIAGLQGVTSGGSATISRCVNAGNIIFNYDGSNTTRAYTGGIVGRAGQSTRYITSAITDCYNIGHITNKSTNSKYTPGIGQICGVFVNPTVTLKNCFGLDTISAELTKNHGADPRYSNYVAGKEGGSFTTAQYFRTSATLGTKTSAEMNALIAEVKALIPALK